MYSIKVPSVNKYYIGTSKLQCSRRWNKSTYKDNSLAPYLNEWDSLIKTVIKDGLTKTEALKMEDDLIQALRFIDLCINFKRSGLITDDINAYQREYYQTNTEYRELCKQYQLENKEKISERRKQRRLKKKLEKQQQTSVH